MRWIRLLKTATTLLASALAASAAGAAPIVFQLDGVAIAGAPTPSTQTWVPGFPIVGSGDIDFGLGTGTLSLPDHSIQVVITGPGIDAQIDVSGWTRTLTAIDLAGNVTATGTGTYDCPFPLSACAVGPPATTAWPPPGLGSSAVIDTLLQTLTVVDDSSASAGTVTYSYSYILVPEPGSALLLAGGLITLARPGRRGSAARAREPRSA